MLSPLCKSFEAFLVESFCTTMVGQILPGQRFQFAPADPRDATALYQALCESASDYIKDPRSGYSLPVLSVGDLQILLVQHGDGEGMVSENYIAMLRDRIAGGSEPYSQCGLLVIHNSLLDTLINSMRDLGSPGEIWSRDQIRKRIIQEQLNNDLDPQATLKRSLMEFKDRQLNEEASSLFGFRQLFNTLANGGVPDFPPLGLFNDQELLTSNDKNSKKIDKRLEENHALFTEVQDIVERTSENLASELEVSEAFVKQYFSEEDPDRWQTLDFNAIIEARDKVKKPRLEFCGVFSDTCRIIGPRSPGSSARQKRENHLLLLVPPDSNHVLLSLEFKARDLGAKQIRLKLNGKKLNETAVEEYLAVRPGPTRTKQVVDMAYPFEGIPLFVDMALERESAPEKYSFHILVLRESEFYIDKQLDNRFLIKDHCLNIQISEEEHYHVIINPDIENQIYSLTEEDEKPLISKEQYGVIDFGKVMENNDRVVFKVQNNNHILEFAIESSATQEKLALPLLFDSSRQSRLFQDNYNGTLLAKGKGNPVVVLDNREVSIANSTSRNYLIWEQRLVTGRQVVLGEDPIPANALNNYDPTDHIYTSYIQLLEKLNEYQTIPSLTGWGKAILSAVEQFVGAYRRFLITIPDGHNLSWEQRQLLRLGVGRVDGQYCLTPFHPLTLAYFSHLARQICQDQESEDSFYQIPSVTWQRLNARGLIPYYPLSNQGFFYVDVSPDNSMWLLIREQQHTHLDFVKTLVEEKCNEFVAAFKSVFEHTSAPAHKYVDTNNPGVVSS